MHVDLKHVVSWFARFGAAVVVFVASPCQAQQPAAATREIRQRTISPAMRDLRVDAVKQPDVSGRVLLDVGKIAAATAKPASAASIVAADLSGNAVAVDKVGDASVAVTPKAGQWVVVRPARIEPQPMQKGLQWLPGVCLAPSTTSSATGAGARNVFSSYADFATVPVVWDTSIDAYRVQGAVGVARNGDLAEGGAIGKVATVKMSFVGVSAASSDEFEISDLGIGGEREFSSLFRRTDVPKPTLLVRSNLGAEQPYLLDVRPRVDLTPRRNPILGLGLEEIVVTAECVEAHGALLALAAASPVTLECSSGREEGADQLAVSSATPQAHFRFRSTWLGPARIVATTRTPTGAIVGSVVIQQAMPWPQVAAALAGGALGGFARRFVRGARRRSSGRQVVEGVIVGLVAFIGGVLGVGLLDLPPIIVATVAGAFFTGVLAGFAGVVVLEKLSKTPGAQRGGAGE